MPPSNHPLAKVFALLFLLAFAANSSAESLREALQNLAQQHHFQLSGLERLGPEPAQTTSGSLEQRIKTLLADYNYLSVGAGDKFEKITILSAKEAAPKRQISGTVPTRRVGAHHEIRASVTGPSGAEIPVTLLVDTGATTVVLPASLIKALGFTSQDLRASQTQTAGGIIQTRTGLLSNVKVGDVSADTIAVSFVPDEKLNGAKLLGMSYLSRFKFSLDDESNELILLAK